MKILSMTATFGKLQHDTLSLKPGMNVIEAPNEWGKSTWCAFLLAMLYGVDTRAKTTKTVIADKERYAPWSGQPMSGRMEILWGDRKITIERTTSGRIPMGVFRAYETETGLEIPQLTAENCGQLLLGGEQSVVKRAGFVSLRDLPVTRDDALLKRLNALVTTGDESGDGERLARSLKDLKNRCRYNKKGLLPQAEEELRGINESLAQLQKLQSQSQQLNAALQQADQQICGLQNHLAHLDCQDAQDSEGKMEAARQKLDQARKECQRLEEVCAKLPTQQQAREKQEQLRALNQQWNRLADREQKLPRVEMPPVAPEPFGGMTPQEAVAMAAADGKAFQKTQQDNTVVWILGAVVCTALAALMFLLRWFVPAIILLGAAGGLVAWGLLQKKTKMDKRAQLLMKYEDSDPRHWRQSAEFYNRCAEGYRREVETARKAREELEQHRQQLQQQQDGLCGDRSILEATRLCQEIIDCREKLSQARKEEKAAQDHLETLISMVKLPEKPEQRDALLYSREETRRQMDQLLQQRSQLLGEIGQCQGKMEALGTAGQLDLQRRALEGRIARLEEIYEATVIALSKLEEAANELQRRFAPRIASRAQELMSLMTEGRYQRLILKDDFSLGVGAQGEDVLHSALWRSEGTVDQLYIALRLAVWEVLTPEAPLILDDALVRFDDRRLEKILELLRKTGEEKQIILFTCQNREGKILPGCVSHKE